MAPAGRPAKRGHDVVDLTDDANAPSKYPRNAYYGTPPASSQTSIPGPSQALRDSWSDQPSPVGDPSRIPMTQMMQDDEEAINSVPDDNPEISLELYGTMETKIVGVRYYNGVATPQELVVIRREPGNQYDRNAIRIDNVMGRQIGHLGRKVVEKLAPYVDRGELVLEGVLTGYKGAFDCPMRLHLYGTSDPSVRPALEEKLKKDKLLKVTDMKKTRVEAEARRKQIGLKSGTTSAGLASATAQREEQEASLQQLVATSQSLDSRKTDDLTDSLAKDEVALQNMPMAEQPAVLKSQLLPYQLQGLAWMRVKESPQLPPPGSDDMVQLWKRTSKGPFINMASTFSTTSPPTLMSGGILADDMGLGKTLQVISLIVSENKTGPTLIVAPVGVLSNWEQQMKFHVKEDSVPEIVVYHTLNKSSFTKADLQKSDVVITSYGMITTETKAAKNKQPLLGVDWRRVVLDEGHSIRNPKSHMKQAVCSLKAKSRWVLTGTPIINGVRDILSLLQFLQISGGLSDEGLFSQVIARPIRQMSLDHPARVKAVKLLGHLMQDICLRRRKDMKFVDLKLPKKTEYIHRIALSEGERTKYNALLSEARGELEKFQSKSSKGQSGRYQSILERLLRLRQVCNHWVLCKERVNDLLALLDDQKVVVLDAKNLAILQGALQLMIESQEECAICMEDIAMHEPVITACKHVFGRPCIAQVIQIQGKCPLCRSELKEESLVDPPPEVGENVEQATEDAGRSAKTEALISIVKATLAKDGSKIVIFSQWTTFLNVVQQRLKEDGLDAVRVDGSMDKKKRDASIGALNTDPSARILLASLGVCSVGLNLVAADTVILSDSWWAPAIEDQAVDRVHRLGQTRETTVWRLVVEKSIEERVLDVQAEKRELVSIAFQEKSKGGKAKETRMGDIAKLLS